MQGVSMAGVAFQNLSIERLGPNKIASPMVLKCQRYLRRKIGTWVDLAAFFHCCFPGFQNGWNFNYRLLPAR